MTARATRLMVVLLVACASAACDGLFVEPAPPGPAALAIAYTLADAAGAPGDAFDRANRLIVRVTHDDQVLLEQTLAFDPGTAETGVRLEVPVESATTVQLDLQLLLDGDVLFTSSMTVDLVPGESTSAEIALTPVVASIALPGIAPTFMSYGETLQLTAAPLFATGDTATGVPVTWSTSDANVVSVTPAGLVTAVGEGAAQVVAAAGTVSGTLNVMVHAIVSAVTVSPAEATIGVGETQAFTATPVDARGNSISARTVIWSSSNVSVATMAQVGIATGVAPGATTIIATSEGIQGQAMLTVAAPGPEVQTGAADGITSSSATLHAVVNPGGLSTRAWFQWSVDPALAQAVSTPIQPVGAVTTAAKVSQQISGLLPATTYYFRVVATNSAGTSSGGIASFTTAAVNIGAPTVQTDPANPIYLDGGGLNGTVNPNGLQTLVWFEYTVGTSNFSFPASTPPDSVAAGTAPVSFGYDLTGWDPDSVIFYRAVAQNQQGTSRGSIVAIPKVPPVAPGNLSVSALSSPGFYLLTWVDRSQNEDRFEIEEDAGSGFVIYDVPAMDETSRVVAPSTAGTYRYRIRACNPTGCSGYSNIVILVASGGGGSSVPFGRRRGPGG